MGEGTNVGFVPALEKFLFWKSNGDEVVPEKSATLGLKSSVSVALIPPSSIGISIPNLASS